MSWRLLVNLWLYFSHQTWFGTARADMYNPVCHGVNSRVTCWVPNAVQKTYINRVMVIFQVAALVLIALELVSQIIGNAHSHLVHGIWGRTLRELKKDIVWEAKTQNRKLTLAQTMWNWPAHSVIIIRRTLLVRNRRTNHDFTLIYQLQEVRYHSRVRFSILWLNFCPYWDIRWKVRWSFLTSIRTTGRRSEYLWRNKEGLRITVVW